MDHPDKTGSQKIILICTVALGLVWIYMGIVPKLIFPETGEMDMMTGSGMFAGYEGTVLKFIGVTETLFGIILIFVRKKIVHILNIIGLILLAMGAWIGKQEVYVQPFSPFVITVSMVALSLVTLKYLKT
jgi:hypothetical protein